MPVRSLKNSINMIKYVFLLCYLHELLMTFMIIYIISVADIMRWTIVNVQN